MYAWRCSPSCPPEYREQTPALEKALERETDFAFKQSFAFCPYSPEAVFRYVQFLMQYNRLDDALVVARTCLKLDPYNDSVAGLIENLENFKKQAGQPDYQKTFAQAGYYMQHGQTNNAYQLLDPLVSRPDVTPDALRGVAEFYAQVGNFQKLETVLQKLTSLQPDMPEGWYDLARLEVLLGKRDDALKDLQTSINLSDERLKTNSKAVDIRKAASAEPGFGPLRGSPDFQKIVSP
jgi:tetratricopeptide (TPR) repeat protein